MKKQYHPQVQYKKFKVGQWSNIMQRTYNGNKKFASSLEEAKQAIENERKYWEDERNGKHRFIKDGSIGIEIEPIKDDTFEIVATRIRVREVTEWEEVEL